MTATVAALLVGASSAGAIPIVPPPLPVPCINSSTGGVTAATTSLTQGQGTSISWKFTPGAGCVVEAAKVLFRDQTSGVVLDTGLRGLQGNTANTPQSSGKYFVEVSFKNNNGSVGKFGAAPVTVALRMENGKPRVAISRADQRGLFAQAIGTPNALVMIGGLVDLDLTFMNELLIAPGVQIIGDRSQNPRGPRLFTLSFPQRLMYIGTSDGPSDNVHISGIRFDGQEPSDPCDSAGTEDSTAITVMSSQNVEIDNNEFYGWRGSAIDILDHGNRINRDNAGTMHVHHNYMHDNQHPTYCGPNPFGSGHGGGYGVSVSQGGFALIEANVFSKNRHAVAGHGSPGDGYLLRKNLFFNSGVDNKKTGFTNLNHPIDMHGLETCDGIFTSEHFNCGDAGEYMEVSYNTLVRADSDAIQLRGTPTDPDGMSVFGNVFAHSKGSALTQTTDKGLYDGGGNKFDQATLLAGLFGDSAGQGCDIDRDGVRDSFRATGATWWYFSSVVGRWVFLRRSSLLASELRDVNGDGRCDVTMPGGSVFLMPSGASFDVTRPADQATTVGQPVSLQLAQVGGGSLSWVAVGLPAGMFIDAGTGKFLGTPTQTGSFKIHFRARDIRGAIVDGMVNWTINAVPGPNPPPPPPAPTLISAPRVSGMLIGQASNALRSAGLGTPTQHSVVDGNCNEPVGTVISQNPAAGTQQPAGFVVHLQIEAWPAPPAVCN